MTGQVPTREGVGCAHESVRLDGRVDLAGCAVAALRCVDCGRLLHGEGVT